MGLKRFLARQAGKPSGWFGSLFAGKIFNKANSTLEDFGLKAMPLEADSIVLEIGFGNGRLISKMAEIIKNGKIYGIDISKEMISQAAKRNRNLVEKGLLELQLGSVEKLPFHDNFFTNIFTANTIYFWPDANQNSCEILRVLKPGGTFCCGFRTKNQMESISIIAENKDIFKNLYTHESITELFKNTGFSDVEILVEEVKPFNNYIVRGRKRR